MNRYRSDYDSLINQDLCLLRFRMVIMPQPYEEVKLTEETEINNSLKRQQRISTKLRQFDPKFDPNPSQQMWAFILDIHVLNKALKQTFRISANEKSYNMFLLADIETFDIARRLKLNFQSTQFFTPETKRQAAMNLLDLIPKKWKTMDFNREGEIILTFPSYQQSKNAFLMIQRVNTTQIVVQPSIGENPYIYKSRFVESISPYRYLI